VIEKVFPIVYGIQVLILIIIILSKSHVHIGSYGFHDWLLPPFQEFICPCLIEMRCSKCLRIKFIPGDAMNLSPERIYKFSGILECKADGPPR
jgi:hypothetical protein